MLIKREVLEGIRAGAVDLVFRRWKRPTVKAGGSLRTHLGVLAIDSVEVVAESALTAADARRAGFGTRKELLEELRPREGSRLYRVELRLAGADPRIELREVAVLSAEDVAEISRRLGRFDTLSRRGEWTVMTLQLVADHPATRAAELAARVGVDKAWLKTNVRKLKELGLTESLGTGYRLSPRGRAYLRARKPT